MDTCVRSFALALACVAASYGCSGEKRCTEGASAPCACPDGRSGAQTCLATGAFAPCVCASPLQAAPPPGQASVSGFDGPHATLEAYCTAELATLSDESCKSFEDPGISLCNCAAARGDGSRGDLPPEVSGAADVRGPGAPLLEASLVRVARASTDLVHCDLALRTTRGVFVLEQLSTCDAAPVAHDNGYSLATRALRIDRDGDGAKVVFEWQETELISPDPVEDPDGAMTERSVGRFRVTCRVDASGTPQCQPKETL